MSQRNQVEVSSIVRPKKNVIGKLIKNLFPQDWDQHGTDPFYKYLTCQVHHVLVVFSVRKI